MKTKLVKIGNSHGIRIPKALIEQAGLEGDINIQIKNNALIITPAKHPRQGWAEAFAAMHCNGDDCLLDGPDLPLTRFDEEEWEW